MTQIDFYTRASDRLRMACILCGKAWSRGIPVVVATADSAMTEAVDRAMWMHPATGFLPHVRARHRLAPVTPVILDHELEGIDRRGLLVNLRPDAPDVFSSFERLIEIVSNDEEDVHAGRQRYRFYRDRGYEIRTHDLGEVRQ
ncbi:MAG: DNA polymerase III subunit chi [Betaproteobacteria bacterium]|nr:DNA polymerase III subunit chi [Betaproteobacteria bacterium]